MNNEAKLWVIIDCMFIVFGAVAYIDGYWLGAILVLLGLIALEFIFVDLLSKVDE